MLNKAFAPFLILMLSALVINNLGLWWFTLLAFIAWIITEEK